MLIVSMHAGTEYSPTKNDTQANFAHLAIDNGAALVIGHHPHVVQPVEKYGQGYIFYSLGNFIFDQMWSESTREGAMAEILFEKNIISNIKLIPVRSFDYSQPRVLNDTEGKSMFKQMGNFTF